jgi:hypothetical protein
MKKPEAERKEAEGKMQADWQTWAAANASSVTETAGAGKTKRITKDGIADVKNDIMMTSIAEADSDDAAAKLFANHPHFGIPEASIEVMPLNYLPGMQK